jgi:hypothetical protein
MTADSTGAECADPLAALIPACVSKPGSGYCKNLLDTCKHADNQVLSKYAVCVWVGGWVFVCIHTYEHTYDVKKSIFIFSHVITWEGRIAN